MEPEKSEANQAPPAVDIPETPEAQPQTEGSEVSEVAEEVAEAPTEVPAPIQQEFEEAAQAPAPREQHKGPGINEKLAVWKIKFKDFARECVRVLKVTKKPDKTEFLTIVKISGIGILVIGAIGFFITLVREAIVRFGG